MFSKASVRFSIPEFRNGEGILLTCGVKQGTVGQVIIDDIDICDGAAKTTVL